MPELPEVETVKRGLQTLIVGKVIESEVHDTEKGFPNTPQDVSVFLMGAKITDVRRRAKVLLIDLSTEYTLVIHLKMTGQLVFIKKTSELKVESKKSKVKSEAVRFGAGHPNDSLIGTLPDKSTRVILKFTDGSTLYFNDQRKFGWMRLMPTVEVPHTSFMMKVGPEPLNKEFTPEIFISRLQRRANTTIKAAILDQTVLAGIGNIYADESLWGAKIHPATRVRDVPPDKLTTLHAELQYVLNLSIEKGGSTDRNYVNAEGKKGSYIDFARVFRQEGKDCPRHPGTPVIKTRVAGRGTHTCPKCQKLPDEFIK